ncbi:hypothetical protein ACJIZ3_017956 [Penstemon smallii]|uniref:At3g05675-like ankyrin-like domain-containing protein n=1 Tax=Penstemon smallii TaxID=265156 RepID=A0ABD3SX13_9LAMI
MASETNSSRSNPKSRTQQQQQQQQQQQLVSTMIKQGFISHPLLSPPPNFRAIPSPTLFDIMSVEQARELKPPSSESHKKINDTVSSLLSQAPFQNNNNNQWGMGDVRLTLVAKAVEAGGEEAAAYRVSVDVHRRMLAAKSRFFAEKLRRSGTHSVEILDCDDVAVYLEAVVLMYCGDELKVKLMGMEVSKILALLKISSAIMFDDGVRACLEYLESVPWSEDEEEIVISNLNQLHLDDSRTNDVLQRVTSEPSTSTRADEIFLQLSFTLLQAKADKPRTEMKALIYRLLREDHDNRIDISKDTLYHICHRCLSSLILCLSGATCLDDENRQDRGALMGEIAREADNMQWVINILIDFKMGDEFVKLWADQKELAILHSKIPIMYRHEISKITAQVCVSIGRGQVIVPKDIRFAFLSTWLEALYDDFAWMRRAGKSIDKKLVEEGLSQTILTLPLSQQQSILMKWFDRFLEKGDDCPNIQRAFEIWWRRAFVKQYVIESKLPVIVCDIPN